MLLDLCGEPVSAGPSMWQAQFNPAAYPISRDDEDRELGLPAFIIAEALAQVGCRAAKSVLGLNARILPAIVRDLAVDGPTDSIAQNGGVLEAVLIKDRPVTRLMCRLLDMDGQSVARATVIAAAMGGV